MWSPANPDSIPSLEEEILAKQAIKELEYTLKCAIDAVKQAQLYVVSLREQIKIRRAWIAPIRRLPVEILSEIFVFACDVDYLAPARITEVCRLWYRIMNTTARVWSLIYPRQFRLQKHVVQYFSVFLERSSPRLLHMYIPGA